MIAIARTGVVLATVTLFGVSTHAALRWTSDSVPENLQCGESAVVPSARTDGVARIFGAPPPGAATTTTHFDAAGPGPAFGHCNPCGSNCTGISTVAVSGLSRSLWDVDARVVAGGGAVNTLSLDLVSPAGTLVHLVSDMGYAGSGETYDDSSAVLVTDGIPFSPMPVAPQGALGQLIGENPNGTWTLQATDESCVCPFGSSCGHVFAFSLDVTTLESPLTQTLTVATNATPSTIPTQGSVTSDITVSGAGESLCDVNVRTFIDHARCSDLDLSITSPAGTTVQLVTRTGASNLKSRGSNRVFNGSLWDDQATPPRDATNYPYVNLTTATPIIGEGKLGRFIGEDPNGTWHLTINDTAVLVGGTLTSWSLELTTCELAEPGTVYCTGDGLDPVLTAECPCGNFGDPGRGCANSNSALGGARMWATGTTSPNTLVFHCEGMPNNSLATFWRGSMNDPSGVVFHDGIQCVAGAIIRFGQQAAGQDGNDPYSIAAPAVALAPGTTRYYQTHYRNPNAGFCPPGLFNLSNGYIVTW